MPEGRSPHCPSPWPRFPVESALQSFAYLILQEHMETCVVEEIRKGNLAVVGHLSILLTLSAADGNLFRFLPSGFQGKIPQGGIYPFLLRIYPLGVFVKGIFHKCLGPSVKDPVQEPRFRPWLFRLGSFLW